MRGTGEPAAAPGSEELPKGGRSLLQAVATALFEVYDAIVQAGGKPSVLLGMLAGLGMLLAAFFERPALLPVGVALAMYGAFVLALRPRRGASASTDVGWAFF